MTLDGVRGFDSFAGRRVATNRRDTMPTTEQREDERAESAWTEVREEGVALLCWDNNHGETKSVELSPQAAGELRREFIDGPSVRHDQEGE